MKARNTIPTILTVLATLAVAAAPASAASVPNRRGHWGAENAFRFSLGEFEPRGNSVYFADKEIDFTGSAEDLSEVAVGLEYVRFVSQRFGVVASGTFYGGNTDQTYFDFTDEVGNDIVHTTELEIATFNIGGLFNLTRRDQAVIPYVGAGASLNFWRLNEFGDFIDFGAFSPIVFNDNFEDDGTEFGWYWHVGVEAPVAPNLSVFIDGRWTRAEADLEGDFFGLGDLDLSGRTYSLGMTWSF